MNLYINTSKTFCELALFQEDEIIEHYIHVEAMKHSIVIHEMLEKILKNHGGLSKIDCVSVLNGPGSYTGLRVGLAAAKGICYALDIPLILLNKLDSLCRQFLSTHSETESVACFQPARQGEYFFCAQSREKSIQAPGVQSTEFIRQTLSNLANTQLISTEEIREDFEKKVSIIDLDIEFIAKLSLERWSNNTFDDTFRAEPFYLKKVHANLPKKKF